MPDVVGGIHLEHIVYLKPTRLLVAVCLTINPGAGLPKKQNILGHYVRVKVTRIRILDRYASPPHPGGGLVPDDVLVKFPTGSRHTGGQIKRDRNMTIKNCPDHHGQKPPGQSRDAPQCVISCVIPEPLAVFARAIPSLPVSIGMEIVVDGVPYGGEVQSMQQTLPPVPASARCYDNRVGARRFAAKSSALHGLSSISTKGLGKRMACTPERHNHAPYMADNSVRSVP